MLPPTPSTTTRFLLRRSLSSLSLPPISSTSRFSRNISYTLPHQAASTSLSRLRIRFRRNLSRFAPGFASTSLSRLLFQGFGIHRRRQRRRTLPHHRRRRTVEGVELSRVEWEASRIQNPGSGRTLPELQGLGKLVGIWIKTSRWKEDGSSFKDSMDEF